MGRLIGYEFRKAFLNKRMLIALVITIALVVYTNSAIIDQGISGYARVYKEVFTRYEGQLATESFIEKAKADYEEQLVLLANGWDPRVNATSNPEACALVTTYPFILNLVTVEKEMALNELARKIFTTGFFEDGTIVPEDWKRYYREPTTPPGDVVHYLGAWGAIFRCGWAKSTKDPPPSEGAQGYMLIILMIFGLSTIFSREYEQNMALVLLTTKQRGHAVWAKIIAGLVMTGIFFTATYGIRFAMVACVYGLDGFFVPALQLPLGWIVNVPFPNAVVGVNVLFDGLMLLLSVLSTALLIMAISASFRSSLPVLGTILFIFITQMIFIIMFSNSGANVPRFIIGTLRGLGPDLDINGYVTDIPVRIIMDSFSHVHPVYDYIYPPIDEIGQYNFIIILNSVISLACLVWIPWIFQRSQGPLWNRRIEKA
jgi:ABC-type transport system involved in multi-copper enzyme maturation permease subunit